MKRNLKKYLSCILLMAVLLTVSAGCGGQSGQTSQPQPSEQTVKIASLRGPSAVSIIPMIDAKTGLGPNIKADYQLYNSPDLLVPDLAKGQVDAALLPPNLAAKLYNQGIGYQLAGVTCWGVMYLASDNSKLTSIKALKGQKLHLTDKGATPDLVFNYLLLANGLKADDLELDYSLGQTELAQSMAAGRIKSGLLVEPWLSVVTAGNPQVNTIIDIQKEWQAATGNLELPQTCLIIKKEWSQNNPQAAEALIKEVDKAINWVNNHPTEAGQLTEKNQVGTKADITAKAIPRLNLRFEDAKSSRPALESFFDILVQANPASTGGKLPDDGFYYQK